jgi:hypothetical protein
LEEWGEPVRSWKRFRRGNVHEEEEDNGEERIKAKAETEAGAEAEASKFDMNTGTNKSMNMNSVKTLKTSHQMTGETRPSGAIVRLRDRMKEKHWLWVVRTP